MAMIFKQPGKTGMEILKHVGLSIEDKNHINKIVNNRNKRMKLNSTIFFLCAGLCSSALIENAFSMKGSEKFGDKGSHQAMVVGQYSESNYNPISIKPEDLKSYPNLQTLHLYTEEDIYNWWDYAPDEKFIDQLSPGNLKNANGLFYKVEIHAPDTIASIKSANVLDSIKRRFISTSLEDKAKYPIRFRNVTVNQAADIGHVDPETGQFIFNDDIYTGYNNEEIEKSDNSYVIRNILDLCFKGFRSLKSILIPNSVRLIGRRVFEGCTSLDNVTIPNSVEYISNKAFLGCANTKFTVPYEGMKRILHLHGIDPGQITVDEKADQTNAWKWPEDGVLKIPDGVESIDDVMFIDRKDITTVIIPDSVTKIGKYAFYGCTGLTSIVIPDSVKDIGPEAFRICKNLKNITIGNGVETIGALTFFGCKKLTDLTIGNNVEKIEDHTFANCTLLSNVTIPDSVKHIRRNAFYGCNNLNKIYVYSYGVKRLITESKSGIDHNIIEIIEKPENEQK